MPEAADSIESSGASELLSGAAPRARRPEEGRGGIRRFRLGPHRAVGKRLRHGGLLGGVTRGLFVGSTRIEAVVGVADRLRRDGVPTPRVLAVGCGPGAGPFAALALVTEEIEGGRNLLELLPSTRAGSRERRALLSAAGALVARLEAARFRHADLNLANLVAVGAAGEVRLAVVDLEGGGFLGVTPAPGTSAGLRRLTRSWEKWVEPRAPASLRDLAALLRGYSADREARRGLADDLLRYRADLGMRRWFWRFGAISTTGRVDRAS